MSRPAKHLVFTLLAGILAASAHAQYPGRIEKKNADTTPPLRATAIYEWTGDLKQPKAGRLIPLAVWDGNDYQPGALYLAQPAPLSLLTGTVYELEDDGDAKGLFTVTEAENIAGISAGNWWIGIGTLELEKPAPKTAPPAPKNSTPVPVKEPGSGSDSDRPVLHRRDSGSGSSDSGSDSSKGTGAPPVDPDRPTLHRKDSSSSNDSGSTTATSGTQPSSSAAGAQSTSSTSSGSSDSDRPTLHRKDSGDGSASSGSGSAQSAPPADPDRPTLHKKDDSASSDNDPDRPTLHRRSDSTRGSMSTTAPIDPDRPRLRRGIPEIATGIVEPSKLEGLPADMKQIAAVSDAKAGPPHPFVYTWADPGDAAKMQAAIEDIAKKALFPPASQNVTRPVTQSGRTKIKSTAGKKTPPSAATLEDETFRAFELSYNGGATLVFTAKSASANGNTRYITLIAQPDFYGAPQVIFKQITNDDQLDITPRMQIIDALDANADNRAELIFELRGKTTRAFAIYNVVNARAEEAFNTGILPLVR